MVAPSGRLALPVAWRFRARAGGGPRADAALDAHEGGDDGHALPARLRANACSMPPCTPASA